MKIRRDAAKGFSMVELMVALAIIAIALITLISVIITNMKLDNITREMAVASNAVNRQLEHWQSVGFQSVIVDRIDTQGTGGVYKEDFGVEGLRNGDTTADPHFASTTTNDVGYVELSQNSTLGDGQNLVRILIRVDWRGPDGQMRSYAVETLRSDRGINAIN